MPVLKNGTPLKAYVFNELMVLPILLQGLRGRSVVLLEVDPILPPLHGLLQRLRSRLTTCGWAKRLEEILPQHHPAWDHAGPLLENMYETLEPEINRIYGFASLASVPGPYAIALRNATTAYIARRLVILLALRDLLDQGFVAPTGFGGVPIGLARLLSVVVANDIPIRHRVWCAVWRRVANTTLAGINILYCAIWAVTRLKIRLPVAEKFDVAVDYIFDTSDDGLCKEVMPHRSVLLVGRKTAPSFNRLPEELQALPRCSTTEGHVAVLQAPGLVINAIADIVRIWRASSNTDTVLFLALVALPLKNLRCRAFFDRYHIGIYWGRDPYNAEHVLRHHHLHRTGGISWAVFQGYPSYAALYPHFRYLNFDRYYMMTPCFFDGPVRMHWPESMEVKSIEAFCATRDEYERRFEPRAHDILFMSSIWTGQPEFVSAIRIVAQAFPDRKIFVQTKRGFAATPAGHQFAADAVALAPNVVLSKELPYDLFVRSRYSVSDPSTVIFEAIQFGNYSFVFDIPDAQKSGVHRLIEGFSVTSGEEIVKRIKGIESGVEPFPIERFQSFIQLDGEHFLDTIRQDLGIDPKRMPQPIWCEGASLVQDMPSDN